MNETIGNGIENTTPALSVQEQQQAYVDAMKQLKQEEKQAKKKKRRKILLIIAIVFVAIITVKIVSAIVPTASDIGDAAMDLTLLGSKNVYTQNYDEENYNAYKESIEVAIDSYIGNKDPNSKKVQSALIEQAQRTMDSGNAYLGASFILEHCADNEEAKDVISECYYRLTVEAIENSKYYLAKAYLEKLDNYKNSTELKIWTEYQFYSDHFTNLTENAVKNNLKDPSSFQANPYNSTVYFEIKEDSSMESGYSMTLQFKLVYSATNSFGGRVQDTHIQDREPVDFDIYGKTIEEAEEIIKTPQSTILERCEEFN